MSRGRWSSLKSQNQATVKNVTKMPLLDHSLQTCQVATSAAALVKPMFMNFSNLFEHDALQGAPIRHSTTMIYPGFMSNQISEATKQKNESFIFLLNARKECEWMCEFKRKHTCE